MPYPGTWLIHCHVGDHIEDAQRHARRADHGNSLRRHAQHVWIDVRGDDARDESAVVGGKPLDFRTTVLLGAIAGFTIFLGLPIARARRVSTKTMRCSTRSPSASWSISLSRSRRTRSYRSRKRSRRGIPARSIPGRARRRFVGGFLLGLVGLGSVAAQMTQARSIAGRKSARALARSSRLASARITSAKA